MKKYRIVIYLAVAALLVIVVMFFFRKNDKLKITWTTAKIERGDVNVSVTSTGTLSAVTTVQVGTQVSGTISKLKADYNSVVKQGQVIALLDPTYLQAAVEDARANLAKAQAQFTQTNQEFLRVKKLLEVKAVAQADYDQALANYAAAKANVSSAQAQLNRAVINLNYATIRAPISGVVISRSVDVGQTVAASFNTPTLFTIANDLTKMQVQASIDEADIGEVKLGQQVSFSVDAYQGKTFKGTVKQIRLQPITVSNVVTYTVIIDVPNPDLKLMPGMTANITVHVEEHPGVLKVPGKALRFTPPKAYFASRNENGPDTSAKSGNKASGSAIHSNLPGSKSTVWIKEGENVREVEVTVGLSDGNYTEVSGPIKEGQEVATGAEVTGGATVQARSPFMPQFGNRGGRRGM